MLRRLFACLVLALLAPLAGASTGFQDTGACMGLTNVEPLACTLRAAHEGTITRAPCDVGVGGVPRCAFTLAISATGEGTILGAGSRTLRSIVYVSAQPMTGYVGPEPGKAAATLACEATGAGAVVACSGEATLVVDFPLQTSPLPFVTLPCRHVYVETAFTAAASPLPHSAVEAASAETRFLLCLD